MADPMADDSADISGMPDPGAIGLSPAKQADPSDEMPEPRELFKKYHGDYPATQLALDTFMANPPDPNEYRPTLRKAASQLTGLPRAAAGVALSIPAGVASIAGQLVGAGGAVVDPENAAPYLEQGRDRGREWAKNVNNLANYIPATKRGAALSSDLVGAPGQIIKEASDSTLGQVLPDNAYQTVGDIAQDIGTDLPALGAPAAVRAGARVVGKVAKAVAKEGATAVGPTPEAPITPPVGEPITGDTLRAQPSPIPAPEGTLHNEVKPAAKPAPAAPALPEADNAPVDMSLSPEQRALVREGVAARRAEAPEPGTGTPSPDDAQRGSVRLFNSPAEEGPKETPQPEQQNERAGHLDAIDRLSGGQLPSRRTSALSGDYNATGDDFQMKEVGSEPMRKQIASENAAMHAATDNVHNSIGSEFEDSVDSTTLGDRGRVTRGAVQGIEGWFDKATDQIYDTAREQNKGKQIPALQRVKAYLDDDSNFTNDAEIGLQRAAKQRLDRLWSTGDPDKGVPPGSVNAAERFREFLNEKGRNPNAMGVAKDLKNHTDMDVAEHGGPGLFQAARAMRRHSAQMLEEPTGIKKLLAPADSQGINHAIPEHKVMDYIADLPREQHEHVLNVLRAGAHLGGGELAEGSAAALREIQAHVISRMHNAARNADGSWNARKFYNAADRYARNAPALFKDRPDVLSNLKTINDAGNTLHMDKHYPGAVAQGERTGALGHAIETGGRIAGGLAHDIPVIGRLIGRAVESGVEGLGGRVSESARDKAVAQRIVDRNGKQRGAVGDLKQRDAVKHKQKPSADGTIEHNYTLPGHSDTNKVGSMYAKETPGLGVTQGQTVNIAKKGNGSGTRMLQRAVDDAHGRGQIWRSDSQVSEGQAGAYKNLAKLGYDVKAKPYDNVQGELKAHGDHVFEVGPQKKAGVPSGQRGSVQLFNDNPLNRAADNANDQRRGVGINPRNERNERVANAQMGGRKPFTAEQNDILRRLSGQRGSVKVMNEQKPEKPSFVWGEGEVPQTDKERLQHWNQLPKAGDEVDGLKVRDHIPNTSSISGSFDKYHVLSGVRTIPFSAFENHVTPLAMPSRMKQLRDEISNNKEINPLIVGIDEQGPYIIEGAHRYDSLLHLGKTEFPAKIVVGKFDKEEK